MSERAYNFNPGPSTLPVEVLEQASKDILEYQGCGMGILEVSHRSPEFMAVAGKTEALIRELMQVPDNYKVLFLQGGASTQFAMVPLNILPPGGKAAYLNTGTWAKKAIKEAKLVGDIQVAYSSEETSFDHVPAAGDYQVDDGCEYLYLVSNNTIYGTQFHEFPDKGLMLVADMSSDILSRPVDVSRFGIIFAGAQKNMGPAGVTVVIIRDDLLDRAPDTLPTMFRYRTHADKGSMFNTPPCFAIHVVGLTMQWLKDRGGVEEMARQNEKKAKLLYDAIDASSFYRGHAREGSRSLMNVTFNLPTPELEAKFVAEAASAGLKGLKGHRSIGGCRASIYNAFPAEGVERLVEFMADFEKKNG